MHAAEPTAGTSARSQLSGLLDGLLERAPGATFALLGTNDGLKLAHSDDPADAADRLAAIVSGLYALARQQFSDAAGGTRQVVIEHDAGSLFVMSAGAAGEGGLSTVLAVVTTPQADPGQVGHQMEMLVSGLDEHLVTAARRNGFRG